MKKWKTVAVLIMLCGLATGCFSKEQEQTTNQLETPPQEKAGDSESTGKNGSIETQGHTTETKVSSSKESQLNASSQEVLADSKGNAPSTNANGANETIMPKPKAPAVTAEQVSSKYKQELNQLRAYYSGQLQSLYSGAIADLKANQESKTAIYSKYARKGMAIQEESQAKVNQTLAKMKVELQGNHLPTENIQVYRSTYYTELDQAKSQAMAQVKKALGM